MRLFLREQIPSMILFGGQTLLFLLIIELGQGKNTSSFSVGNMTYMAILSIFIYSVYFIAQYIRQKEAYAKVEEPARTLEQSIVSIDGSPLFVALQKKLQNQYDLFRSELQQAKAKMEDNRSFILQWVHQMKTPLSVMTLILQKYEISDEKESELVQQLYEEMERLRNGLELVLYSTRFDQFEHDFHITRNSLETIIRTSIGRHKKSFIRNHVYPELQINQNIMVETDEKWLTFVIDQIITNAIKYSAHVGQKLLISCEQKEDTATLSIQDFGVGIPIQDLGRVFEPFFTGVNGRKFQESTGMGLYLVKQILEKLHHTVSIESEEGNGTTVTISFHNVTKM